MTQLSTETKSKIEDKIASLEAHTSCEFVCVFRERSLFVPSVIRFLMPKRWILQSVETAAHLAFLEEEIFATSQRTGIMIYISEAERAVYVMADKGVTEKISAEEFRKLGEQLAKDFSSHTAEETFLSALDEIAKRLGKIFPPHVLDVDELENRVR